MMFNQQTQFEMQTIDGSAVPLDRVHVESQLTHLLCETNITQYFHNKEKTNIEAVYTFPLPSEAVLLELNVIIGDRKLKGLVSEKQEAMEAYEEAITEGNQAIMLEQSHDGIYTINIGNLQKDEKVSIHLKYNQLMKWQGKEVRFSLPTTIAPRYGDALSTGIEPHQVPESSASHDNRFAFKLSLSGLLRKAHWSCPSHKLVTVQRDNAIDFVFTQEDTSMDRDLVINFEHPQGGENFCLIGHDIDGYTALASFYPRFDFVNEDKPRNFKIVIDCSGSMGGDSIRQARTALLEILDGLRPIDEFNIIAFGSSYKMLFESQVRASEKNVFKAIEFTHNLNADLGGTEMEAALEAAINSHSHDYRNGDILLITDGEIWSELSIIKKAKTQSHRIFTVGIGTSSAENVLRKLSTKTGGAAEFVFPGEAISEKIVRHFKRIFLPQASNIEISWPPGAIETQPSTIDSVYDGDTCYVFAKFSDVPQGFALMTARLENGEKFSQKIEIDDRIIDPPKNIASDISRMRAHTKISELEEKDAVLTAVTYQLVTQYTNTLVVDVREESEQAEDLPELRKVPQNLAAGWGATSTVFGSCDGFVVGGMSLDLGAAPASAAPAGAPPEFLQEDLRKVRKKSMNIPESDDFLDACVFDEITEELLISDQRELYSDQLLLWIRTSSPAPISLPPLDILLATLNIAQNQEKELLNLAHLNSEEKIVAAMVLLILTENYSQEERLVQRIINKWLKDVKKLNVSEGLNKEVKVILDIN